MTEPMSAHAQPLSALPQLRGLLEVTRLVRDERDLTRLVDAIAATISVSLDFHTVAINLYRPAEGDFQVAAVHGNEIARKTLLGTTRGPDAWTPYISDRFLRRGAYFIPHDEADWESVPSYVPDLPLGADPDAWHPEDALIVPMHGPDGDLLGVISVDEPDSGSRPTDETLDVLVAIAAHVGTAVEAAHSAAATGRHRVAPEQLLRVSSQLPDARSSEELLQLFCDAIRSALGFQSVAAELFDDQAGHFRARAAVGWSVDGPELRTRLTRVEAAVLLDSAFEREGCFILPLEEALARLPAGRAAYASRLNGVGPRAWNRHWLIVPLRHRNGELLGYVWVDDPADRLLPPRDVLTLRRTFANPAAAGLHAAADFQQLARRNDELAAAEEALRRSEELHRHVVDGSTDLIALLDPENRIVLASSAYEDVLGYSPAALVGTELASLLHPEDLAAVREQAVHQAVLEPATARLRASDGRWVLVEGISTPIRGDNGEIELILVIARDVTESQRLHEQLRQVQKMESIGRLAGGIAHDFNNLLTAINGYAELMLMDFDAGEVPTRDSAEQIARAAGRAASLTGQLLAFSRKQVLRPQVIDLNEVVGGMAMLARMLGEDVVLSTAFDSELAPTLADPTQIEQVVLNLALNARDAMPNGGSLMLRTAPFELGEHEERPHPDLKPGSYVALTVRDTGVGIEPELAANIFEPFFTTKGVGEGTGLGLATVEGIVSQSGGVVWVDSTPGEGTTFTVCLPLAAQGEQSADGE